MALSLNAFTIMEVAKPNIGERQPSRVRADVSVHLAVRDNIKMEWEQLRKHDVCFLLTLRPPQAATNAGYLDIPAEEYCSTTGLVYVRGCEIEGMLDDNGRVIEEYGPGADPNQKARFSTNNRTYRVLLNCNQYREDMDMTDQPGRRGCLFHVQHSDEEKAKGEQLQGGAGDNQRPDEHRLCRS